MSEPTMMSDPTMTLLRDIDPARSHHTSEEMLSLLWSEVRLVTDAERSPASATRSPRKTAVIVTGLVGLLCAAGATALSLPGIGFFAAEPAPERILEQFSSLNRGAPEGLEIGVDASEARQVLLVRRVNGKHTALWVAPTSRGGFCATWEGLGGGCDRNGVLPLSVEWGPSVSGVGSSPEGAYVAGFVRARYANDVVISFRDGESVKPVITWVSAPIGGGFFFYAVPDDRLGYERRVVSVAALDKNGGMVRQESLVLPSPSQPPVEAIGSRSVVAATARTATGTARVLVAPTRYEGRCVWLEYEGSVSPLNPCKPRGVGFEELAVVLRPEGQPRLIAGTVGADISHLLIVYSDRTETIVPHGGVFASAITGDLTDVIAVGGDGKERARVEVPLTRQR
jgi:hypothetical protein